LASRDLDQLFSMSVFEAALVIQNFRLRFPQVADADLVQTIRASRADFYTYDYEAGLELERCLSLRAGAIAPAEFFTRAIEYLIERFDPLWVRLAPGGRDHVMKAMSVNGVQCLRAAGLTAADMRAAMWWDWLINSVRASRDAQLVAQGREGERRSLEMERDRLRKEGLEREPIWVALDDNSLGYDILSYIVLDGEVRNRLIEVKTTASRMPRFIISRNEWRAAEQYADSLVFHVWLVPTWELRVISTQDVSQHIAINRGNGEWLDLEIIL
jgi:Domain of unknown function (DUF3883)